MQVKRVSDLECDVAVIGAGLAGTSAASMLAGAGHATVLIDTRTVSPPEFRAEKLGAPQTDQFDRIGLGARARAVTTPVNESAASRPASSCWRPASATP